MYAYYCTMFQGCTYMCIDKFRLRATGYYVRFTWGYTFPRIMKYLVV